ncbi:(2Fe-2S)-binding protein [Nonomuraea sp. NPDC026600]|uniref:(2Fe-2S)-binding protein n=1 Tax=Nonomuraea sp. NPDC026600 TaxID=3155363 RepID=UPI00340E5BF4
MTVGGGIPPGCGEPAEPTPGHPFFVRRSCCLYYRLPSGGECSDCAFPASRSRMTSSTAAGRSLGRVR